MGIFNRLLLLPYSLLMIAATLGASAMALHIIPESVWLNEVHYALSRQEFLVICAVLFLVSLKFFFAVFTRSSDSARSHGEIMVVDTPSGAVQVELAAIKEIVERIALSVQGIREAAAFVSVSGGSKSSDTAGAASLQVELRVVLTDQASLGTVSEQLKENIRQDIMEILCIDNVPVSIRVTNISNASAQAKRRVV